jgi:hypothetical protein
MYIKSLKAWRKQLHRRHFNCINISQSDHRFQLCSCYELLHTKLTDDLNYVCQILWPKLSKICPIVSSAGFTYRRDARCWWYFTLHIINVEKNVSRLPFHFFLLPYLCLHTVGLVRMEVVWIRFDALFFISEFYFLFLLNFTLFSLAYIYICVVKCFSFTVFASMFVCLLICFVVLFRFHSIFCIYLFIVYAMWLYFINFSLKVYVHMGGPGGSGSYVVGSNNSYKPITNTAWVRAQLCKLQKRVHSTRSCKW